MLTPQDTIPNKTLSYPSKDDANSAETLFELIKNHSDDIILIDKHIYKDKSGYARAVIRATRFDKIAFSFVSNGSEFKFELSTVEAIRLFRGQMDICFEDGIVERIYVSKVHGFLVVKLAGLEVMGFSKLNQECVDAIARARSVEV